MAGRFPPSPTPMGGIPSYNPPRVPQGFQQRLSQYNPQYMGMQQATTSTICLGNLPDALTEREFRLMFKFAPGFERSSINRTNAGHQVGYARFATAEEAQQVLEFLHGYPLDDEFPDPVNCFISSTQLNDDMLPNKPRVPGRRPPANVSQAKRQKTAPPNPNSIYVGGIPHDWESDHLKLLFGTYGNVTSIQLNPGRNQDIGKIAFIYFASPEEAQNAIAAMNNYRLENGKYLVVRYNTSAKSTETLYAVQ